MDLRPSLIALAVLGSLAAAAQDKQMLYRYVDSSGRVYYSDRAPTDRSRPIDAISRGGSIVKKGEAPLTPEEIAAREEAKKRQAEEQRLAEIEHRRNVALLTTYPNERDIEDARTHSLKPHQEVIRETEQRIATQRDRREKLRTDIANQQAKKTGLPEAEKQLRETEIELRALGELLESKKRDVAVVNARFDEDKRRWADIARARAAAAGEPKRP